MLPLNPGDDDDGGDDDGDGDDGANWLYLNIQIRSNATESFAPMSLR